MPAPEVEGLIGSRRPVIYPHGLPAGEWIFSRLSDRLGLKSQSYSPRELTPRILESLFAAHPALLVVPTSTRIDRDFLRNASGRVACFASVSTGTDHVDLDACQAADALFLHAPGVNAASVAEYTAAAAVHARGRLPLSGETAGIVGYGRIGRKTEILLRKLGFTTRWYDPFVSDPGGSTLDVVLDSDLVTFHVPLTRTGPFPTYSMVDEAWVDRIRRNSIVINTSRGKIFTEAAFLDVCSGTVGVMDVFPREPPDEALVHAPAFATPHIAGYNYTARAGGTLVVAEQFARILGVDFSPGLPDALFTHNVIDFLPGESALLKGDPGSFSHRREEYPDRGDLRYGCGVPPGEDAGTWIREKLCGN